MVGNSYKGLASHIKYLHCATHFVDLVLIIVDLLDRFQEHQEHLDPQDLQ